MERHINAWHQHERWLAAIFGHAAAGIGLQRLQTGNGACHGILLASQVVVHDLQELAGTFDTDSTYSRTPSSPTPNWFGRNAPIR